MKPAMCWYDNSKDALPVKIERAAEYYREKYGEPRFCHVHPAVIPEDKLILGGLIVSRDQYVMSNHLMISDREID